MADYRLGEIESKFADLIWENEPLTSRRLAELALDSLNWKRSTTYTVLKRLCDRGLFQNQGGTRNQLLGTVLPLDPHGAQYGPPAPEEPADDFGDAEDHQRPSASPGG